MIPSMSVKASNVISAESEPAQRGLTPYVAYAEGPGYGWVLFASVLLLLIGTANLIEGLAAIGGSTFFTRDAHYIVGSLTAWGWTMFFVGIVAFVTGGMVLLKNQLARWAGTAVVAANLIAQLLFLPAYPFWSLSIIALDVLALYGLLVHGGLNGSMVRRAEPKLTSTETRL